MSGRCEILLVGCVSPSSVTDTDDDFDIYTWCDQLWK